MTDIPTALAALQAAQDDLQLRRQALLTAEQRVHHLTTELIATLVSAYAQAQA